MRAVWMLVFFFMSAFPAWADLRACQDMYINAPKSLGGYALFKGVDHEKERSGAGYSVQYRKSKSDHISVFFYDRGQNRFSNRFLATELSVAASNIYRARALLGGIVGDVVFDRPDEKISAIFGLAYLNINPDTTNQTHDFLTIGAVNRCIVKLIYSYNGSKKSADLKFNAIARDWVGYLSR